MADPRPGELTPKLAEMIVAEIKRQNLSGKSSRQIAREFGVHYQTVANYRRRLEKAGVIERLPRGGTALKLDNPAAGMNAMKDAATFNPSGTFAIADFWTQMPDMAILTGEQILKRLSYLSVSPEVPPTIHIAAAKALFELKEAEAAKEANQLSIPETEEEALAELRIMRQVVGAKRWLKAHEDILKEEEKWAMESAGTVEPASAVGEEPTEASTPGSPVTTSIQSPGPAARIQGPTSFRLGQSPSHVSTQSEPGTGGEDGAS